MSDTAGKPCILCSAIAGSLARWGNNPLIPITVGEQIASSHASKDARSANIHACVCSDDETASNAALIARAADVSAKSDRTVSSIAQIRQMLELRPA